MATKQYDWAGGATLEEHSRRKHKILREYFFDYLTVRCQSPHQSRFRLGHHRRASQAAAATGVEPQGRPSSS